MSGIERDALVAKWQGTVELLAQLAGADTASIVGLEGDEFHVLCTSGSGENRLDRSGMRFPVDIKTFCQKVLQTDALVNVGDASTDPEWRDAPPVTQFNVQSYLGVPIHNPDHSVFGTICVKHSRPKHHPELFLKVLEQLRDLVETQLQLAERARQMETLAQTDSATGIANRRGLWRYFESGVDQRKSEGVGLGVLYCDIDNLKATNDRFGHACGDRAIELLAGVFRDYVREGDIAARVGGDEFVLVARIPTEAALFSLRDRIVADYAGSIAGHEELALIGLSVGAVFLDTPGEPIDVDQLLSFADRRMYQQKSMHKGLQEN